jgi:DNA-binding CsgD family transcriptional regulator
MGITAKLSAYEAVIHTTKQREWWGWFGSISWLFFMMYGYDMFMLPEAVYFAGGSHIPFFFMVVAALSITAFSWWFRSNPNGLSKIAFFSTPAAMLITAVIALLPQPINTVLFIISPTMFAPVLVRRVYGVFQTSGPHNKITRYMSGIVACVALFTLWMIIEPPKEIAFIIPTLFAVIAWIGVQRSVSLPVVLPSAGSLRLLKRYILLIVAAVVTLFWFDKMNTTIHYVIINTGIDNSNVLYIVLGLILPLIGFILYGIIHDNGYERLGFICGMSLCVIGILIAIIPNSSANVVFLLLAFTDGLGGTYTEFFILTIPAFFMDGSRRPVFVASLGIVANLLSSAYNWLSETWVTSSLGVLGVPLFLSTAISAFIFIMLVFIIFEQHQDKTLAASIYTLLYSGSNKKAQLTGGVLVAGDAPVVTGAPDAANTQSMINAGLTPQEIKIALLLMGGSTRSDILRKLHISAAELGQAADAIHNKLSLIGDPDPRITAAVAKYKLTKREADMLRYLRDGASTEEIAAELYITEATVRVHIRNLLKKLGVETRDDVSAWLDMAAKI